jgi:hypothetical protein
MKSLVYFLIALLAALAYRTATSSAWQDAIGGFAIALVKPLLIPIVLAIAAPAFVYVVALLILVAAVTACVAYWVLEVRPRQRQIAAVGRAILDLPQPVKGDGNGPWTEAMQSVGTLFRDNGIFVSAWSEYQAQAMQSGRLPSAPFSHFVALEPEGRARAGFMQSLPGYFTSLGLIFTFVGLVVALYFAAKGFRSNNIDDARAAIIQLLNTASFKFLTSVAALIGAMAISLFLRFCLMTLGQRTQSLAERVEAFLTAWREQLATQPLPEAADAALDRRLELLVDRIEQLTQAVETLAKRDRVRLVEPDHAIRG